MSVTISHLYDDDAAASRAIKNLEAAGLARDETIVASNAGHWHADRSGTAGPRASHRRETDRRAASTGSTITAAIGGAAVLLGALALLVIPGLGAIVAGGIAGALIHAAMREDDAEEAVRRGGTLVTANVPETERARFEAILERSAVNRNREIDRRSAA
jgi:hypothetical protein